MTAHQISLDGISVCIGMPAYNEIHPLTVKSIFASQAICNKHNIPCELAMISGNSAAHWARDEVISLCLKSSANKFFLIDSDTVWEPEDFMRLLALSTVRDIVCASYPAKKEPQTFYVRFDESKPLISDEYGLIEILGIGLGFTVIDRKIMQFLSDKSIKVLDEISGNQYSAIFQHDVADGKRRGEDMHFFEFVTENGFKIHLDPSINLGHIGLKVYRGKIMDALRFE